MSLDLFLNNYYNINTYAPIIFGSNLKNLKLVSILDYNTAIKFSNIPMVQKQIEPYLPPNSPLNFNAYTYYKFIDSEKNEIIIADIWLIPDSIVLVTSISANILVTNITTGDIPIIRDQLRLLGYTFQIEQL